MGASDPVSVPRWLLVGGGGLLVGSLLGVAFLAGRVSAPQPVVVTRPAPPTAAPAAAPLPAPEPVATASAPSPAPAATAPPAPAPEPDGAAPDAAVPAYLAALDAALTTSAAGGDPDELAQAIVADALSGSTVGIDTLIENTRRARARAAGLQPPSPAAELHRQTLSLLDDTLTVYADLRAGITKRDLASLDSLQPRAAELGRKAAAIDAESTRLKARYP